MKVSVLLFIAALDVVAIADRCVAPFKTLSSDCRGSGYDINTLCVVLDQRTTQPSPCRTGTVAKPSDCATASGQTCDILTYMIKRAPTEARFHIKFPGVAPMLHRSLLESGSSSGSPPIIPPNTTEPTRPIPTTSPQPTHVGRPSSPPATRVPSPISPRTPTVPPSPHVPPPPTMVPSFPIYTPQPAPTRVDWTTARPSVPGNEGPLATEINEFVEAIGALRLDPALTDVRIVGGNSEFGTRGQVVKLTLDHAMLTQSPHVTSVWVVNCGVGDQIAAGGILSAFPAGVEDLNLQNTMMLNEPIDLSSLTNVKTMSLQQNYLSTLSNRVSLSKLTMVDLTENALTSFEANLPMMESLYMSKNKFTTIPDVVYSMTNLKELSLSQNPIVAMVISSSQYDFLSRLLLSIDKPTSPPPAPIIYWTSKSLPTDINVDAASVDLSNAVGVTAGTLTDLQGFPVWTLPDSQFKFFMAQQRLIAQSRPVVNGQTVETYQAKVAESTAKASTEKTSSMGTTSTGTTSTGTTSNAPVPPNSVTSSSTRGSVESPNPNGSVNEANGELSMTENTSETLDTNTSPSNGHQTSPAPSSVTSSMTQGKTSHTLIISVGVIAAFAALVAGIVFVHRRRNHKTDTSSSTVLTPIDGSLDAPFYASSNSKPSMSESIGSFGASVAVMQDDEVRDLFSSRRIRTTDLEDVRPIGAGASGIVWLVKLRGSRLLASKRLIDSVSTNPTALRLTQFVNEIVIAAGLDHPNIVRFIGVSWTNDTDLQALYEYMPHGNLETHLKDASPDTRGWSIAKLRLAIEIVEALVCTHSFSPPLLHRDLRTQHVLLDENMNPKLSNFGSARFASEQNTMTTEGIGSGRWLAPEILRGSTDYDAASDMFAFGVLLSELDSHQMPYEDAKDANGNPQTEMQVLELVARDKLRPRLSPTCPSAIRDLASRCWSQARENRPTAIQVAYELRLLQREWE